MSRWTTRRFLGAGILALTLVLPVVALAVPAFTVLDLGLGVPIDISATGRILGQDAYTNSVPWVLDSGVKTYLPLPPGVATATASRISGP